MAVVATTPAGSGPSPAPDAEESAAGDPSGRAAAAARRRWLGLLVITGCQLLIVLDGTVVNVALPAMTADLGLSEADRQWIITSYTLAFGGLLMLGGRIADYLGLRRTFLVGIVGFGVASALAGCAPNFELLLTARALQGVFGALMAPAGLALLANTFTDPMERIKAFSLFGTVAGAGSAVGLVIGGVLTEAISWRATMLINVPVVVLLMWGAAAFLDEFRAEIAGRLDWIGATLATAGLVSLVYGFSEAERSSWTEPFTLWLFGIGGSLLIVFVVSQRMVPNPLLPLRVLADRNRAGANLAVMLTVIGLFGVFFFMSFYFQEVLGYSALKTGLAFLPVTLCIVASSEFLTRYSHRFPPRALMAGGLIGTAVALGLFTRLDTESSYRLDLIPGMVIMGLSITCVFVPAFNVGTWGVEPRDAGVASALINTSQQVGGSLGLALLSSVAASRKSDFLADKDVSAATLLDADVAGYARATLWAMAIMLLAAALTVVLVNAKKASHDSDRADGPGEALGVHPVNGVPMPVAVASGGHLAIRAVDAIGRPLMGVAVSLLDASGRQVAVADTGVVGRCALSDLPAGEALLVAVHPSYAPFAQPVVVPASGTAQADVQLNTDPVRATLITGEALTPQGWLIADARVSLIDVNGVECAVTRTDSEGRYAFTGVPEGDYTLLATGYGPSTATVRVGPRPGGAPVEVDPITLAHPEDATVADPLSTA